MSVVSIAVLRYRVPLAAPINLGPRTISKRDGVLVRVETEQGAVGWGDVAPLPGFSAESLTEAIDALLDVWPIFEAFQLTYVSKGLLLEQEKNASALSPNGPSAGASDTAKPAHPTRAASKPARTARRG